MGQQPFWIMDMHPAQSSRAAHACQELKLPTGRGRNAAIVVHVGGEA